MFITIPILKYILSQIWHCNGNVLIDVMGCFVEFSFWAVNLTEKFSDVWYLVNLVKGQVSLWCGAASICQMFSSKYYFTRTTEQNVIKFGIKDHWGKGNQLCIDEGDVPTWCGWRRVTYYKENLVQRIFCYAIWCRITQLRVVVHHGMMQCHMMYCDLPFFFTYIGTLKENLVQNIFFMLFDAGSLKSVW